jgi:hypothetical protein
MLTGDDPGFLEFIADLAALDGWDLKRRVETADGVTPVYGERQAKPREPEPRGTSS